MLSRHPWPGLAWPKQAQLGLASGFGPGQAHHYAKLKPKSTTPLRRSASDSLPSHANPTPTLGSIQPIFTLATAERYPLPRLRSHANLPAGLQALHESWWISKWGNEGKEGEVFVSSNGSIVCWGLGEADAKKFAAEIIDCWPSQRTRNRGVGFCF